MKSGELKVDSPTSREWRVGKGDRECQGGGASQEWRVAMPEKNDVKETLIFRERVKREMDGDCGVESVDRE